MNVIEINQLGKLYRLGNIGTGTLSHDLNRFFARIRGKEDPYLKLGIENDRTVKSDSDFVWALKDVSFSVKQGETLGIIGKNGAGKSTLLKILSRTTTPTTGHFKVRGRIASLLEVGTGFHPELSGRENVFLNGAIMGMQKSEIKARFDEIVDFSGVERYIDTPVKRYSSGMYVRLAFAVAAHLEPDILIVDEVLAVGDAEFQKKCLGKMKDVSGKGRTVLFVSHNMAAVRALCSTALYLKNGKFDTYNSTSLVIERYLGDKKEIDFGKYTNTKGNERAFVKEAYSVNGNLVETSDFTADEEVRIIIVIEKRSPVRGMYSHVTISDSEETVIIETDTVEQEGNVLDTSQTGTFSSELIIPKRMLKTGTYFVSLGLTSAQAEGVQIESLEGFVKFNVTADRTNRDLVRRAVNSMIPTWRFSISR